MNITIRKVERPVYLQIYKQMRNNILDGIFPFGSKVPSKRLLAAELHVSIVTVEHAYALLCDEGYAESRERSGYIVIFRPADGFAGAVSAVPALPTHSSASTYPSFSVSILSRTIRKVLADSHDILLERSPNAGLIELREAIRQYLARNRSIQVDAEQIVVGSGAEYLYRLIVDLFGRDKIYAIESPAYDKLGQIYHAEGVSYEELPLVRDGIDSDALARSRADILHTTPYRSFPSGVTATASKRHEYIRWSEKADRFIIESDYGSEFSVSSQPMETLFSLSHQDRVIYLNTFSKTISPSMRAGYMVLPRRLVTLFQQKLGFYSCSVPTFEQLVLTELLNSGDFERHINRERRARRKALNSSAPH